jgi:uncharacterized protein (DUF362 family)
VNPQLSTVDSRSVFCATVPSRSYDWLDVRCPELPAWAKVTTAVVGLRTLLADTGLDHPNFGSPAWNPFGQLIRKGAKVVVKPNWVSHSNGSGHGIDCLVTHPHVIEAIVHYAAKAQPASIVIGDAPVQGCAFEALMSACGMREIVERFTAHDVNVSLEDFRRTIHVNARLGGRSQENCRPLGDYVLCDLGSDSELEAITAPTTDFRVTMYNPDALQRTHQHQKHQYLVARDVLDADVVFNVPKLKTHKKVGITGAIKNAVGINGHKEYLPHHRKGGSENGGDCYSGQSHFKGAVETLLDVTNRARGAIARQMLANVVRLGTAVGRIAGVDGNYEGSWHGNDTAWRMSLDLQRVLHYGGANGMLADKVQRTIVTITDAIVAGEGEGPLAPSPKRLGMMTLAMNVAAAEWVHALLMGLDPQRIPLTRQAFASHRYPLTSCQPDEIAVRVNGESVAVGELISQHGSSFRPPRGWSGHCELVREPLAG